MSINRIERDFGLAALRPTRSGSFEALDSMSALGKERIMVKRSSRTPRPVRGRRRTALVEVTKQGDGERLLGSFELGLERWQLAFAKDLSSPKRVREIAARELGAVKLEVAKARRALGLKERGSQEHERLMESTAQIRAVESRQRRQLRTAHQAQGDRKAASAVENPRAGGLAEEKGLRLAELRGGGIPRAWVLVHEVFAWRTFRNRREVGGFLGYTPTPAEGGERSREQGISKAGTPALKALMTELAWAWLQYQPQSALSRWEQRRFAGGGTRMRKVGSVALARKLLIALWRYIEFGVLPDEALLKAAA